MYIGNSHKCRIGICSTLVETVFTMHFCTYRSLFHYALNAFCEGISLDQAKKSSGVELAAGAAPMPREMSFPLGASENWSDVYDYIRCMRIMQKLITL